MAWGCFASHRECACAHQSKGRKPQAGFTHILYDEQSETLNKNRVQFPCHGTDVKHEFGPLPVCHLRSNRDAKHPHHTEVSASTNLVLTSDLCRYHYASSACQFWLLWAFMKTVLHAVPSHSSSPLRGCACWCPPPFLAAGHHYSFAWVCHNDFIHSPPGAFKLSPAWGHHYQQYFWWWSSSVTTRL